MQMQQHCVTCQWGLANPEVTVAEDWQWYCWMSPPWGTKKQSIYLKNNDKNKQGSHNYVGLSQSNVIFLSWVQRPHLDCVLLETSGSAAVRFSAFKLWCSLCWGCPWHFTEFEFSVSYFPRSDSRPFPFWFFLHTRHRIQLYLDCTVWLPKFTVSSMPWPRISTEIVECMT